MLTNRDIIIYFGLGIVLTPVVFVSHLINRFKKQ